ncbi:hypothetical protein K474DRAFT_1368074 [Panus rudis PR-1116 ss-1]|nr:hypothetical protein K474DRAFT_1368074 [Panus rudis PR-1116 ss-1]
MATTCTSASKNRYSIPTYQNNSAFPIEIYERIIQSIHPYALTQYCEPPAFATARCVPDSISYLYHGYSIRLRTLYACALTCRDWYPISQSCLLCHIHFQDPWPGDPGLSTSRVYRMLQAHEKFRSNIRFLSVNLLNPSSVMMGPILPLLPNLSSLAIISQSEAYLHPDCFMAFKSLCPPVIRFELVTRSYFDKYAAAILGRRLLTCLPKSVQQLYYDCNASHYATPTSLRPMQFRPPPSRAAAPHRWFRLKSLESGQSMNGFMFLVDLPWTLFSLTHLTIWHGDVLHAKHIRAAITQLRGHTISDLKICFLREQYSDRGLVVPLDWSFLAKVPSLRRLYVEYGHITASSLVSLLSSITTPTIQELYFNSSPSGGRKQPFVLQDEKVDDGWRSVDRVLSTDPRFQTLRAVHLPSGMIPQSERPSRSGVIDNHDTLYPADFNGVSESMDLWKRLLPATCDRGIVKIINLSNIPLQQLYETRF